MSLPSSTMIEEDEDEDIEVHAGQGHGGDTGHPVVNRGGKKPL